MNKKKTKNTKGVKQEKEKKKKEQEAKNKQKEKDYERLEEYLNESGLSLAFNIIFAELISKQILPENFFTYTSMRLTQIGKEIEGLKTKEAIFVDEEVQKVDEENNGPEPLEQAPQEEKKEDLFMTRPQQQNQTTQQNNVQKKKK